MQRVAGRGACISLSSTLALGGARSVGALRWWLLHQVGGKQQRRGWELQGSVCYVLLAENG